MTKRKKLKTFFNSAMLTMIMLASIATVLYGVILVDNHSAQMTMGQSGRTTVPEISEGKAEFSVFGQQYIIYFPTAETFETIINAGYNSIPSGLRLLGQGLYEGACAILDLF